MHFQNRKRDQSGISSSCLSRDDDSQVRLCSVNKMFATYLLPMYVFIACLFSPFLLIFNNSLALTCRFHRDQKLFKMMSLYAKYVCFSYVLKLKA